jgi:hypothetical protein
MNLVDNFDMDLFDQPRAKSILHFFDVTFPVFSEKLKFECNYYIFIFPYVEHYFTRKQELIFESNQNLIASSISFDETSKSLVSDVNFLKSKGKK